MTCKDCPPDSKRPTPHPGPRCATHHRARRRTNRDTAHGRRLAQVYGITADDYAALLFLQGGTCAICQRARGLSKRLSVDHDHAQAVLDGHDPEKGCRQCVRGLLCTTCNKMLGHLRDDPQAFLRAQDYLTWPPMNDLRTRSAPSAEATATSPSAPAGSSAAGATGTASSASRT